MNAHSMHSFYTKGESPQFNMNNYDNVAMTVMDIPGRMDRHLHNGLVNRGLIYLTSY